MLKIFLKSIMLLSIMILLTGVVYPLLITGIAQVFFNHQANGSLIKIDNKVVGSALIGQEFLSEKYFKGRLSATSYKTVPSGASNLGPTSEALKKNIDEKRAFYRQYGNSAIPVELLTASASGVDPDISIEAAYFQLDTVAKARNFNDEQIVELKQLIKKNRQNRQFGFLGEERINVLLLNIDLDKIK